MPKIAKSETEVVELTVSNRTILRISAVVVAILIGLWAVKTARHALLLILISFFLALALNAPVHFIAKHLPGKLRGSRGFGTSISYLIVLIILGCFIGFLVPSMVHQTENFVSAAPKLVSEFRNQSGGVGRFIRHYHLQNQVNTLSKQLSDRLHDIGGKAFSTIVAIGKSIFSLLTVIVLTFMMLVEGPRWARAFRGMIPTRRHEQVDHLARDMYRVIKGFVNGQVILALIATALITPALYILHISYPIALIVVIFVCGLIPMVGHTIGAVIVTIVALFHSITSGVSIFAYYILYQQFENYVIQPKLQANATKMSPLLVFASLIIGINFGGLFGGLIAIPVAGCLRIVFLEILRMRKVISTPQFDRATVPGAPTNATEGQ
ncbi:MAG TPA: AI-2E family transporter [Candidatus Saccharimonadales bacterium]|jgi:predicted PurR-regulated permease PerM